MAAATRQNRHSVPASSIQRPAVGATAAQADPPALSSCDPSPPGEPAEPDPVSTAADDLILRGERVAGVVTRLSVSVLRHGRSCSPPALFNGLVHDGTEKLEAVALRRSIRHLSLAQRLRGHFPSAKTGTPPPARWPHHRLFGLMECQPGDDPVPVFSFWAIPDSIPGGCHAGSPIPMSRTHAIIRGGLDRSPMFIGVIEGVGPRYARRSKTRSIVSPTGTATRFFSNRKGLMTHEIYPQGVIHQLAFRRPIALVRSIRGLETMHILRPGYAIEYDYFDPTSNLKASLETKSVAGLFSPGQINRHDRLR